ncbi:hypothetical protein HYS49_01950 [Candidatus Woesearchaeota archaeon]|nr:hypothetical protein [Candidatus Woesearchaeota archaeon]
MAEEIGMAENGLQQSLSAIILSSALAFSGGSCAPGITEGLIYDKDYEPASGPVEVHPLWIESAFYLLLIPHLDEEEYILRIRQYDPELGRYETSTLSVSPEIFSQVRVGDYFNGAYEDVLPNYEELDRQPE